MRGPTRQDNLLDVVLTDRNAMCSVTVLLPMVVNDHCLVRCNVDMETFETSVGRHKLG